MGRWKPSCHYAKRAYLRLRLTQRKQSLEMKRNRLPDYIEYLDPKSLLLEMSVIKPINSSFLFKQKLF